MVPDKVDVVVIGAGFAGLRAATALVASGVSVAVVEARDRVGGRTLSVPIGRGTFDLGGQFLGPGQDRVAALAGELGVATFPTFCQGRKVLELGGKRSTYKSSIPSVSVLALIDMQLNLRRLDRLSRQVPLHDPGKASRAAELDAQSVEAFVRRHARTRAVRELMDIGVQVLFGAESSELSLLHFLFYCRSGGGLMRLLETRGGAQQDRFVPGSQTIASHLAARLGDAVVLSAPVSRIAQDDAGVSVTTGRGTIRAARAIVAVPPALAARIDYEPALPAWRDQLVQRVPMGSTIKVVATYAEPFWRRDGLSGEAVSSTGPVAVAFDNTSHDNAQPALLGFIVGRAARQWAQLSDTERRRTAIDSFVRLFGDEARRPEQFVSHDWAAERWSRGCPVGVVPPGAITSFGASLRPPVGRLHWAGTETAVEWNGYLEGALESGDRAAAEVIGAL